ncbi:MAG: DedA family protein [Desulfovibrio sp.]|jgi:membrane protein DedA with SNARE-associated domain|nr:DedA family protein [Desulfovibrio sp.]
MLNPSQRALLRKYWWIIALIAAAFAGIFAVAYRHDFDAKELLSRYGYLVILIWTFLEGETIVIIAGIFAPQLQLTPWFIALAAFGGSFLSDQIMFSLGRYKGPAVLTLFPRIGAKIDKAAALFKKYDNALILGFRFVYGVRNVTPILLGISGVSHKKFFCLNAIGASVWALVFSFGGYYAGKAFMRIMDQVGHGIFYFLLLLVALALAVWFLRSRRAIREARKIGERKREKTDQENRS